MTQRIGYVPNEVKGLVIVALSDTFGKGKGKMCEMQGYQHFAKIGVDIFKETPEDWGYFYRSWYNSPRKNLVIENSLWQSMCIYSAQSKYFRISDVFVMCILIGIAQESDILKQFIEKLILSNEDTKAYRSARNQKNR